MVVITPKAAGKAKRRGSAAPATATARGSATTKGLPRSKTTTTTATTTNRFRKALGKGPSLKQRKLFKLSKVMGVYGFFFDFLLGVVFFPNSVCGGMRAPLRLFFDQLHVSGFFPST